MEKTSFVNMEVCLSRRADLVLPLTQDVLTLVGDSLGCNAQVRSHWVMQDSLYIVNFLVCGEQSANDLRNRLIIHGEQLLDQLFSRHPWRPASLLRDGAPVSGRARAEIYVKCDPADSVNWYERLKTPFDGDSEIMELATHKFRDARLSQHTLKCAIPLLASHYMHPGDALDSERYFSADTSPDVRELIAKKAVALREGGDLLAGEEAMDSGEIEALSFSSDFVRSFVQRGYEPLASIRGLMNWCGFTNTEGDYLFALGAEIANTRQGVHQ